MIGEIPSHFTEQKTKERSRHKGQKWAKQEIQNKKRNKIKKRKKSCLMFVGNLLILRQNHCLRFKCGNM